MPNTLAHLGIQAITSRTILRHADPRWIFTGCVIPDIPWILQRLVQTSGFSIDWYDLRIYAIIQASLFCSLFLCGTLALLSLHPRRVFLILAGNVVGHLLLDAMQTKWGNGVHLFAPMSWTLWNAGWFWPESPVTYLVTILGLATVAWIARKMWRGEIPEPLINPNPTPKYLGAAVICMVGYLLMPFPFMQGPEAADNHFVHTLREKDTRTGKPIAFDRVAYRKEESRGTVRTFGKEILYLDSTPLNHSGTLSLKGRFIDQNTLHLNEWHEHTPFVRDTASILGLGVLAVLWGCSFFRRGETSANDRKGFVGRREHH